MPDQLDDIKHEITVQASLERVSRALNDPEEVTIWLGCLRYTGALNSVFYMQPDDEKREANDIDGATHCELLKLDSTVMEFTWYFPDTPKTIVRIEIEDAGSGKTKIHLRHTGWAKFPKDAIEAVWEALNAGWKSGVLTKLRAIVSSE